MLSWGKQLQDLTSKDKYILDSLISKTLFKNYIASMFG